MDDANASAETLSMELPSEFDVLEQVVDETQAFLAARLDDEDLAYKVVLLATEAVTNAIEHGNAFDPGKKVRMWLRIGPERVELCVEDEGGGFNPEGVRNPLDDQNLLVDGGRGVFLIEEMADEVSFEDQGRRVRMHFNRSVAGR